MNKSRNVERSAIVGGAGLVSDFMIKLLSAVKENGGSESDIHIVVRPEGKPILDRFAKDIVGAEFPSSWEVQKYTIYPSTQTTIKGLIDKWKKLDKSINDNCIDPNITDANFPTDKSNLPQTSQKVVLIKFDKPMRTEQAIAEAKKHRLRQPTIQEFIIFITQHPDLRRNTRIIGPFKPWDASIHCLTFVCSGQMFGGQRDLRLNADDVGLSGYDDWCLFVCD